MESTQLLLILFFAILAFAGMCKSPKPSLSYRPDIDLRFWPFAMDFAANFACFAIVYMYTKTAEMKASGHFKMNKKQKKKDKTPGTIFD